MTCSFGPWRRTLPTGTRTQPCCSGRQSMHSGDGSARPSPRRCPWRSRRRQGYAGARRTSPRSRRASATSTSPGGGDQPPCRPAHRPKAGPPAAGRQERALSPVSLRLSDRSIRGARPAPTHDAPALDDEPAPADADESSRATSRTSVPHDSHAVGLDGPRQGVASILRLRTPDDPDRRRPRPTTPTQTPSRPRRGSPPRPAHAPACAGHA